MASSAAPDLPADIPISEALVHDLLDVSITGTMLLRPVYDALGASIIDLEWVYLNPAAQRMLQQPARPTESFLTLYPLAGPAGVFAFYRDAFLSGQLERRQNNYRGDGLDGYYLLVARRHGALLLVSFDDTNDHDRPAIEEELRQSQARELAARTQAEAERNLLQALLTQAPVAIGLFQGPELRITTANARMATIWGRPPAQVLGQPLLEAVPELRGQGFDESLARVLATQIPVVGTEAPAQMLRDGKLQTTYYNFVYQPLYDAQGQVLGVVDVAIEVTEQVLARQQVQQVQQLNEQLAASNSEYLAANQALRQAQQALQRLNEELEARVAARTAETRAALHEAERQREQARVQQGLLQQILGQVPAAIATLGGPEHRFTFFNEPYLALSGNRAVLGRPAAEVLPEVVEQGFIALLDQVYATGQAYSSADTLVMLHNKATGRAEQQYLEFVYQPLFNGQQRPQGVLAFILDVTERVRARKQADTLQAAMLAVVKRQGQERENVYQLFTQAPAAICLLREPDHRIDYLNPAYQALFPGRELRGHTLAAVQPEAPELVALLDGIYQSGQAQFQNEVPVHLAPGDGQPALARYFDFTYQAYHEEGHIAGVTIFGFDVTERVLARQQREAQRAELQRIFQQAPVAIAILRGPELRIELANTAVEAIWGRAAAQVLGRPYFEALPETAGQGFEQILADVLRTGQPFFVTEAPVQLPRAQTLAYVNFVFQPLFDEQQRTTGLMAIGIEVTEQVLARQQVQQLNEELLATNRRLTRTNTDLDTFVYTASHDLKAPIANIEGLLTVLRGDLPPEVLSGPLVPRLLNLMDNSVARFQQTIGHLTNISQLQKPETAETVDLTALIEAVRLDLAPLVDAAQATLTVQLDACATVRVAPKTLRSVVYNLLSNAVKYRDPARPVLVQLRGYCTASHVVLEVQDNGLGLSQEQIGQLFGMFRRLHAHVEGSGVGLFMVKRLIENAGGTITVQSQLGIGSTFTVSLPT
ncbi:MAG: PAS domain-containing sensor histidine kinase [Janthinobacterium lividum]